VTIEQRMHINDLEVEVVRKAIKNLHLGVYPPDGRVRVAAPLQLDDEAVRLAIITRLHWIRRQQQAFVRQERQSLREMVTGESHYFAGRRYRLEVIERRGRPTVCLRGTASLELVVPPQASPEARAQILDDWYRHQLYQSIPPLLENGSPRSA